MGANTEGDSEGDARGDAGGKHTAQAGFPTYLAYTHSEQEDVVETSGALDDMV